MNATKNIIEALFAISNNVRYVAVYDNHDLVMKQRDALGNASSTESDRYEELLVNPTLISLHRREEILTAEALITS